MSLPFCDLALWQECQPFKATFWSTSGCHHLIAIFLLFRHPVYENNKESVVEFGGVPNLQGMHVSPHPTPWEKNKNSRN